MKWFKQIFTNRIVQHVGFWILFLWPCTHSLISAYGTQATWSVTGIVVITLSVCYFNLYFLIPRFLLQEKILTYIILVVLLTLVYSGLWVCSYMLNLRYVFHSSREVDIAGMYFGDLFDQATTIAITTGLKLSKVWFRQQQRNKELMLQTLYSEIRLLKSQINPHFLFNTLNNLYAFTLKKSDKAPETVLKLSYIMEYMIYESNEPEVPLEKEIRYLQDYIDLERLRQTEKSEILFEVIGHVNGQKIAPLLLLPFVENAFKHGIHMMADNAFVSIKISVNNEMLDFEIENHKPLYNHKKTTGHNGGFGIKNVTSRLALTYPQRYDLDIQNEEGLYKVKLKLEL